MLAKHRRAARTYTRTHTAATAEAVVAGERREADKILEEMQTKFGEKEHRLDHVFYITWREMAGPDVDAPAP